MGRGNDYGGGADGGKGSSCGDSYGIDDSSYNQVPPPNQSSYGGAPGSYPTPGSYTGNSGYGSDPVPPNTYVGGPDSYPPSYGAPHGNYGTAPNSYGAPPNSHGSGEISGDMHSGGRSGTSHHSGYGGRDGGPRHSSAGGYGASPTDPPQKVKQCDGNCADDCDNSRIYISNLPLDVTVDELRDLFGGIGQVKSTLNIRFFFFLATLARL